MPRGRARRRGGRLAERVVPKWVRLENRLVLLAWLNRQLGYDSNRELLEDTKRVEEGFDPDSGRSRLLLLLRSRGHRVRVPWNDLVRYDRNLERHLKRMNAGRRPPITLRYFQHLAALYTEIVLDRRARAPGEFLRDLNLFVGRRNGETPPGQPLASDFTAPDLDKLAFWMATGSGKTLLFHLNYHQYLHYAERPPDNVLLITPNEGLSEQHLVELAASGIPARRFDDESSDLFRSRAGAVRVIEITKLVEKKRGGGASVPVDAFDGENLVFVDEGHKGSGGERWRAVRDRLAETGFTFEYSATFGQALTAAKNEDLAAEYGKAIVFDYSYRYFHGDGFGKDFRILNLREWTTDERTDLLLLGNLLSFYQQQLVFAEGGEELVPYNLAKPLWVFVGGTVKAVYIRKGRRRSDVLTVARFFQRVLRDRDWALRNVERLLSGESGLVTEEGKDLFAERYERLSSLSWSIGQLWSEVLDRVFHAPEGGGLHLAEIRGSAGEIGLRVSTSERYFGVIYIGDTGSFKKLVKAEGVGITLELDAIADSLFGGIGRRDTSLEVLIGARKFMEGWNSWRVSNMGLLNVGRGEGSQIIQLFGRGVRLKGLGGSMKRSAALPGEHPKDIRLRETLDIFAVRAEYMARFREHVEAEGVSSADRIALPLPIRTNRRFLRAGLVVPRPRKSRDAAVEHDIVLEPDASVQAWLDRSPQVQSLTSDSSGIRSEEADAGTDREIPAASLDLVDWEAAWLNLLAFREHEGLRNLAVPRDAPRAIMATTEPHRLYRLGAESSVVEPASLGDREELQDAVEQLLRNYTLRFHRARSERWDSDNLELRPLTEKDANFRDYTVRVAADQHELAVKIERLIQDADALYRRDTGGLPRLHFDRHLYQPLLLQRDENLVSDPPGLNEGERRFVSDLRVFWELRRDELPAGAALFLLRNLDRGRGVGFFERRGFYPDFILWVKRREEQRIVFIEPHGMVHAQAYRNDEKARLHLFLADLSEKLRRLAPRKRKVTLDSFIVSETPFEELRLRYDDGSWDRQRFEDAHILFPWGPRDYLRPILALPRRADSAAPDLAG